MSTNNANATTNNENEAKLVNENPILFKQSTAAEYLTKLELCDLINMVFKGIFADYRGVEMKTNGIGVIEVNLAFLPTDDEVPKGKIQATKKIGTDKNGSTNPIIQNIQALSMTSFHRKLYDLTDTAKTALSKLMIPESAYFTENNTFYAANSRANTKGGINWNGRLTYIDQPDGKQIVIVAGFSIESIMGLIHGNEIDGHAVQYRVAYDRPIGFGYRYNGVANVPVENCLIRIDQADVNEIAELATKVNNYIPVPYGHNGAGNNIIIA